MKQRRKNNGQSESETTQLPPDLMAEELLEIKMDAALKQSLGLLEHDEARYLIGNYYELQRWRIRYDHQLRKLEERKLKHPVLEWQRDAALRLENQTALGIMFYARHQPMGRWAMANSGIGPIIAAALCAHIDLDRMTTPTAGSIWSFAGLNPTSKWEKGEKRPWNAALKNICWKIGQSFIKVSNRDGAHYGHYFKARKDYRVNINAAGGYSERAKQEAERFDRSNDCWWWNKGFATGAEYKAFVALNVDDRAKFIKELKSRKVPGGTPMLAPSHINNMAARDAVKLFLSHWFEVAYFLKHGVKPPAPFPIAIQGHAQYIPPFVGCEAAEVELSQAER